MTTLRACQSCGSTSFQRIRSISRIIRSEDGTAYYHATMTQGAARYRCAACGVEPEEGKKK